MSSTTEETTTSSEPRKAVVGIAPSTATEIEDQTFQTLEVKPGSTSFSSAQQPSEQAQNLEQGEAASQTTSSVTKRPKGWLRDILTQAQESILLPQYHENAQAQAIFDKANCLTWPLVFVLVLVCAYVWGLDMQESGSAPFAPIRFRPGEDDTVTDRTLKGVVYASIIQAAIIVLTLLFVGMLHFRLEKTVYALVFITFSGFLAALPAYLLYCVSKWHEFPVDAITFSLVFWNFGVVGAVAILWENAPRRLADLSLLLASVALTWPFCSLPELALWFLVLFMIIWDLFAVLTPIGPLRYAMYLEQQRKYMAEEFKMPSGMVFERALYQLGLMDLVFYGVIVGRAAMIDACTTIACVCAIIAGLIITIAVTPENITIPALPITLTIGVAIYFGSRYTLQAFGDSLAFQHYTV